jgi:hypothetical protein
MRGFVNGTLIGPASQADAEAIARLSAELGYPQTAEQAAHRLSDLLHDPDHIVLVAETVDGVVGWLHGHYCVEVKLFYEHRGFQLDKQQNVLVTRLG